MRSNPRLSPYIFQVIVFSVTVVLLCVQIVTKKLEYKTPGDCFEFMSKQAFTLFTNIGDMFVAISEEIFKFVSIKTVADAIHDMVIPIGSLLLSPYSFFIGVLLHIRYGDFNTSVTAIGTGVSIIVVVVLALERLCPMRCKPSYILNNFSSYVTSFYEVVGIVFALVSNFYNILKLDTVVNDAYAVGKPTIKLLVSPLYSIKGYFDMLRMNSMKSNLILAGSVTLLVLSIYGYYTHNMTFLNTWVIF